MSNQVIVRAADYAKFASTLGRRGNYYYPIAENSVMLIVNIFGERNVKQLFTAVHSGYGSERVDRCAKMAGFYRETDSTSERSSNDNSPKIGQGLALQAGRSRTIFTAGVCLETKFTEASTQPLSVPFRLTERPSSVPAGSMTRIMGGEAERISGER